MATARILSGYSKESVYENMAPKLNPATKTRVVSTQRWFLRVRSWSRRNGFVADHWSRFPGRADRGFLAHADLLEDPVLCILEEPHDPKSCHVRFLVIPRTLLFLLALLSLPSFANDGMRISRHQADRIDSCLGELTLVGKSADSLTRARIEASVRTIRAQLEPRWTRPREPMGMDSARFLKLSEQVRTSFPYREQRKFLRLATIDSRFTVAQVDQLLRLVTHGSDQAEAANLLLPRIVDLENVADLRDVLWTVQGGKALDRFIDSVASQPSNHSEPSPRRSRRSAP